jgi:hypothetical protein
VANKAGHQPAETNDRPPRRRRGSRADAADGKQDPAAAVRAIPEMSFSFDDLIAVGAPRPPDSNLGLAI